MKKTLFYIFAAFITFGFPVACEDYDDSEVKEEIEDLQDRVSTLESLVATANTNIATLQKLYEALAENIYVTDITALTGSNSGYVLTFSDGSSVTIYNGQDGEDGYTPVIGIAQDSDGNYYWTLDGEWLTDSDGNKVKAVATDGSDGEKGDSGADGEDGEDGVTPQLKIDEDGGMWISYDEGETWISLDYTITSVETFVGSIFTDVSYDSSYVYVTLSDGTVLTLLRAQQLSISFGDTSVELSEGETVSISYTLTGADEDTQVYAVAQDGYSVTVNETDYQSGSIDITAPDELVDSKVLVFVSDGEDCTIMKTISVLKAAGVIVITTSSYELTAAANTVEIEVSTNTNYEVSIPEDAQEWITYVSTKTMREEVITLSVAANTGEERYTTITLTPDDEEVEEVTILITQEGSSEATFETVRAMSEGVLDDDRYIEGYIVSDIESMNVCSAPQTGQFTFDRTENEKTSYIESTDGQYGFALKFDSEDDNILERYSLVQISLSGLTLEVNEDPEYYTLSGLTASSIISAGDPDEDAVPVKEKTIAELTDDDIFTLTSVTGLEILQKDGAYTNCTDGYSLYESHNKSGASSTTSRWDVAPLLCYDADGETIFMLTNAGVSWRRDGTDCGFYGVVPQGSGTFKGIVVADDIVTVRFGDCGRYQLRAMVEDDIDLNDECFSTTLVEWTWDDLTYDLTPETGSGTITVYNNEYTGNCSDYNNTTSYGSGNSSNTNNKGLVAKAGIYVYDSDCWWDADTETGNYFDVSFSTSNISGSSMILGVVWGHGVLNATSQNNPSHWKLLYSVDGGSTFTEHTDAGIIKTRGIVWWTTTTNDSCPGFTEHIVNLPDECFGKESVVLRFQVADDTCDAVPSSYSSSEYWNNLSVEQGTLSTSYTGTVSNVMIGTLTIRYN